MPSNVFELYALVTALTSGSVGPSSHLIDVAAYMLPYFVVTENLTPGNARRSASRINCAVSFVVYSRRFVPSVSSRISGIGHLDIDAVAFCTLQGGRVRRDVPAPAAFATDNGDARRAGLCRRHDPEIVVAVTVHDERDHAVRRLVARARFGREARRKEIADAILSIVPIGRHDGHG